MSNEISSADDIINVQDIIERVEELEDQQPLESDGDLAELDTLKALLEDLKGNGGDHQWDGDWYPGTLIRDSHFEAAMDDLLEDIGELPKNIPSYLKIVVDYGALQADYSSVAFEGVAYWYR